jgi:YVTN family beta-propeller protein
MDTTMTKYLMLALFYGITFNAITLLYAQTVEPNTVVATITTGVTPAGIAITPNNQFAYVANNNNYGITNEDSVTVINLATKTVVTTIHDASFNGNQPYTVTINAAGTKAYVTNSVSTTITIINIATNTVSGVITGFNGPSGMVITPDQTTAYVNNYGAGGGSGTGNTVSVVNLNTNTITGTITVGMAPASLAITPDGNFVYVINYVDGNPFTGTISIINTRTNTVVPPTITGFSGPFGIAITPDGNYAYVTNFGSNNFAPYGTTVSVVNLNTNTIVNTVTLGIQPSGIAITPDGRYAYASNYNSLYAGVSFTDLVAGQGTVNIIDIASNMVIPPIIAVDQAPDYIAINANGTFAYVSNYSSNTVNTIALPSFALTGQGCKTQNIFLAQTDLINKLTWNATGTALPVSYSIYRDAGLTDLIATIPAEPPLQFFDHNRAPNITYTYYLVGTNAVGTTSLPITIIVTQNCSM